MAWIQMRDFWTFRPTEVQENKQHLFECKDSKSDTGHSLLVHVAATHSAIVNGNWRFYRPDSMQDSVHTWLPQKDEDGTVLRTPRPVLIGHDEKGDVLGRVLEAKYIDTSWKMAGEYPIIKDFLFYGSGRDARKRKNLFQSVDWITDNLAGLDNYTGLGYTDLGLRITNPDAIRKVFNDEYLTVSVGFKTNAAFCSVCHQDWAKEGKCEHKLSQMVDGKRMFLITGDLVNEEVSFVNFPADPFATTLSKKVLTDSLSKTFFLGLPTNVQDAALADGLKLTDGLLESDMAATEEPEPMTIDMNKLNLDELGTELKSKELSRERAFAIKDAVVSWSPEGEELQAKKRALTSSVNAKINKNKWTAEVAGEISAKDAEVAAELKEFMTDTAKKEEPILKAKDGEPVDAPKWNDFAGWTATAEADKEYFADAAGATGEVVAAVGKDEVTADVIGGLEDSLFAGPMKTFPAHDATYVAASLKVLETAKLSDELNAQIKGNLEMKDAEYKIGGSAANKDAEVVPAAGEVAAADDSNQFLDKVLKDEEEKAKNITAEQRKTLVATLKSLDAAYDAMSTGDDARWALRWAIRAMLEDWSADESVAYALANLGSSKDHIVLSASEAIEKDEAINNLTAEKDGLVAEVKTLQDSRVAVMSATKRALATQIVMHGVLKGTDGFVDLTPEQRNEKITSLASRHITSLRDSVSDLLTGLKFTDSTAVEKPVEVATVADNAQITDPNAATTADVKMTDEQLEAQEADAVLQRRLRLMNPKDRARFIATQRFKGTATTK